MLGLKILEFLWDFFYAPTLHTGLRYIFSRVIIHAPLTAIWIKHQLQPTILSELMFYSILNIDMSLNNP